jgi:hypothetical protein
MPYLQLTRAFFAIGVAFASFLFTNRAIADPIIADEGEYVDDNPTPVNFGTLGLNQFPPNPNYPNFNACGCGPVAATNSLVYLEKQYPLLYGTSLTGGFALNDLINTTYSLANYMGYDNGVYIANFVSGKYNFFQNTNPYVVISEEISPNSLLNGVLPSGPAFNMTSVIQPSPNFLYTELATDEDVELFITDYVNNVAISSHFVTAYKLIWYGTDGLVSYIDSKNGTAQSRVLSDTAAGLDLISSVSSDTFVINAIIAESPGRQVPEPSSFALLIAGLGSLAYLRFRKKRSADSGLNC